MTGRLSWWRKFDQDPKIRWSDLILVSHRARHMLATAAGGADGGTWEYVVGAREWSNEEMAVVNQVLEALDGRDISMMQAYIEIAARLPEKTVRDVAARVSALRSFDPSSSDLAVSHMGAATAAAGLPVPGAQPAMDAPPPGLALTGPAGEALPMAHSPEVVAAAAVMAAQSGGTWNDPAAMFTGPSSVRSTMHPQTGVGGGGGAPDIPGAISSPPVCCCSIALIRLTFSLYWRPPHRLPNTQPPHPPPPPRTRVRSVPRIRMAISPLNCRCHSCCRKISSSYQACVPTF